MGVVLIVKAAAPSGLGSNSYEEVTGYTGMLLLTSQCSQVYDTDNDCLYFWGGHPPGGGFPQPDEIFKYDPDTKVWTCPRPALITPSSQCVDGGANGMCYDEALHGLIKFGNITYNKGYWHRMAWMTGVMQVYTPSDGDWHFSDPVALPEPQPWYGEAFISGGARTYDRISGTFLYTTRNSNYGGGLFDPWRNLFTAASNADWLLPNVEAAGNTVFDPVNKRYILFDGTGSRVTKWYTPGDAAWVNKTPSPIPAEWTWGGSSWTQGTTYPSRAYAETSNYTMNAAAAWDDISNKAVYFVPVAVPRIEYEPWEASAEFTDLNDSVRPTVAGGGWQGYLYTALVKITFDTGDTATAPVVGDWVIDGAAVGQIFAVTVTSGAWGDGDAAGTIYFKPHTFNNSAMAGAADLYDSDKTTLITAGFINITGYQVGGTCGESEPTWPTGNVVGNVITPDDGTITWGVEAYEGDPRIDIWEYDSTNDTWALKTSISGIISHRVADLAVSYMKDHNLYFISDLGQEGVSKFYNYRYATGTVVQWPKDPSIVVNAGSCVVSWTAVAGASGYNIYRATITATTPWTATYSKLNVAAIEDVTYTDETVEASTTYAYHVTAIVGGTESRYSPIVRSDCKAIWDGYVQINTTTSVTVNWDAEPNAATYNVYRAAVTYTIYDQETDYLIHDFSPASPAREMIRTIESVAAFGAAIATEVATNSYTDTSVNLASGTPGTYKIYAYCVTSVNDLGIESGKSAYWLTIPDQPRRLQWTETWVNGTGDVALKWTAPPQSSVTYRVYQGTDSDSSLIKEITTDAIAGTTLTIEDVDHTYYSGFYVTAIDSLGQEGSSSSRASIHRPDHATWDSYDYLDPWYVLT